MRKTYSFKLYNSKKNKHLHTRINVAGEVYNHMIALHKRYYRMYGRSLNKYQLQNFLPKLKRLNPHWKIVGSQALQDIVFRIDFGYQKFFKKENKRPPSFRKIRRFKSFTLTQAGWNLLECNKIQIGKHVFKFSKSREIEGMIKTVTIKRDSLGDIYLFFSCELPDFQTTTNRQGETSIGFDFGLKMFLTPHVGEEIQSPLFFKQSSQLIAKANKNLASKKKGSNQRKKARMKLARTHKKVANKRKDHHFKLAKNLATTYDILCFEDLSIEGMKRLWGRKVSDLGFSEYMSIQKHQCLKYGSHMEKVDRFYPSSKTCSHCLHIKDSLALKERIWTCEKCNTIYDRDRNAAINIHREGLSSYRLGNVRQSPIAIPA